MTERPREERPAAPAASRWVKVWDLPTRLCHWLLVCLVAVGLMLLLLALVACHVAGVVAQSLFTHDNLGRAIITGWKRLPPEAPVPISAMGERRGSDSLAEFQSDASLYEEYAYGGIH